MKRLFILFLVSFALLGCGKEANKKELITYKNVAATFLDAVVNGDGEKVCNMLVPIVLEENYGTLDECKQVNSSLSETDGNVTYKIISEKKLTGEDYEEWIGNSADYYGIGKRDISEVIKYKTELYVDNELIETVYFNVVNYKNEWLIVVK